MTKFSSTKKFDINIETLHSISHRADLHGRSDDFRPCIAHKLCTETGMLFWHDPGARVRRMHSRSIRRSGVYRNEHKMSVDSKTGIRQLFQAILMRDMRISDAGILKMCSPGDGCSKRPQVVVTLGLAGRFWRPS
jgi:hypothetical protein